MVLQYFQRIGRTSHGKVPIVVVVAGKGQGIRVPFDGHVMGQGPDGFRHRPQGLAHGVP